MYDFEELDFYQLLGVSRSASPEEIKRAYRREIAKYHPDRFVQAPPAELEYARRRSQMLTEAYATLSDFAARSSYNLDQRARERRSSQAARPTPPPPQPRDHQAELYDQARAHFDAGRYLQAAAVLRQLQQLNPFYRDSAELLAATEERLRGRAAPAPAAPEHKQSRLPLLVAGITAIAVVLIGGFWLLGGQNAAPQAAEAGRQVAPATATSIPPTEIPPTATPIPPTEPPPTMTPAPQGALLLSDDLFDTGWAAARNTAWSVGPSGERYRITAAAQVGVIWSYRSVSANDVSIAADLEIIEGEGGLMLRFNNERNYLIYTVAPASGEYRLEQVSDGEPTLLVAGTNDTIRAGDGRGRIEARLRGRQVSLVMNGMTLANVELPGASNAPRFGLVVVARDTRAEVFFDNLEIRALP